MADFSEYLVVAGETAATRAFWHVSLAGFLSETDRGDNLELPYVEGRSPVRGWLDQIDDVFEWFVDGRFDPSGNVNADPAAGLDDNLEHYRALFRDNGDEAGRVAISLHTPSRVLDGLMQVRRWTPVRTGPHLYTVVTRIVVAAGRVGGGVASS